MKKNRCKRKKKLRNPKTLKGVLIYDTLLKIVAIKSSKSYFPKQKFFHPFSRKTKAKVYGLSNGCLYIKGKKSLWKNFNY